MWDIDSIVQQHNYYALDNMMSTLRTEVIQTPQPKNWSLSVLAERLRTGPPVLSELAAQFTSVEIMAGFLELIMRYLPEHETEILGERGSQRLYRFCELFNKSYFPLARFAYDQSIQGFVESMPISLLGMSYAMYHELAFRPGYVLLLSLLPYPYEGDWRDEEDDRIPFQPTSKTSEHWVPTKEDVEWLKDMVAGLAIGGEWIAPMGFAVVKTGVNQIELRDAKNTAEVKEVVARTLLIAERLGIKAAFKRTGRTAQEKLRGAKIALLDRARQIAGENAAGLILPEGWDPAHIHRLTDGTLYDGAGTFADWVYGATGCVLLDHNYEDCSYHEGDTEPHFEWSKGNIKMLSEQAPKVRQLREKIDNLVGFIEGDPPARFSELLKTLRSEEPKKYAKRADYDPMDHHIPLDEAEITEDDDDD